MKYPKIETLWNRDPKTFKVIPGEFRKPEFELVKEWMITEKIDGMNVRVISNVDGWVEIRGRTDRANLNQKWMDIWYKMFTKEKMDNVFERNEDGTRPLVILYGEGYGGKIQKGGNYRPDVSFRLFDIRIDGWWLQWDDVSYIASTLGIQTVPVRSYCHCVLPTCHAELEDTMPMSLVSLWETGRQGVQAEGIVARTNPILCDRTGERLFWKLKFSDLG